MNNEFIDGIWFAVQHIVVVRDMPAIAIGIIKESNLSIDDCYVKGYLFDVLNDVGDDEYIAAYLREKGYEVKKQE